MRVLLSKYVDLSSYFDKINEDNNINTTPEQKLNDNHRIQAIKGNVFGQLHLELFIEFCNTIEK